MNFHNIINKGVDFGSFRSSENFFSFTLKTLLYILPAVILGHYTDVIIKKLQSYKIFGNITIYYILLQTFIIIITLFLFVVFLKDFSIEFQKSTSGGFFIVLYFSIQENYLYMLKEYMNSIIKI